MAKKKLDAVCARMYRARRASGRTQVHSGVTAAQPMTLAILAQTFALREQELLYFPIDRAQAKFVLHRVLGFGLAYDSARMPYEKAEALADEFLAQFPAEDASYYTNMMLPSPKLPARAEPWNYCSWNPATRATFDAGVFVLSSTLSGCFWVEEED